MTFHPVVRWRIPYNLSGDEIDGSGSIDGDSCGMACHCVKIHLPV
jgi:hypothetical protein